MPVIQEPVRRTAGRVRWTQQNYNPADALTEFRGAHVEPLVTLVRDGSYVLRRDEAELAERTKQRQVAGYTTR